jgi:hypothetical protein
MFASEKAGHRDVIDLAENFILFGLVAEIFARQAGLLANLLVNEAAERATPPDNRGRFSSPDRPGSGCEAT